MKNLWQPLEHKVYRELKKFKIRNEKWLLGVSGGADSMALLYVLFALRKVFGLELVVVHFHHGRGGARGFRARAQKHVLKAAKKLQIPFVVKKYTGEILKSEDQMRQWRRQEIKCLINDCHAARVALAHHQDDLVETRMIRLIRGTGPYGLTSMSLMDGKIVRPFIHISKEEILQYLKLQKISWLEDPSNLDSRYFRNWMRHKWLVSLEKRKPGATRSLARSLELLSDLSNNLKQRQNAAVIPQKSTELFVSDILSLPENEQKSKIHLIMRNLGVLPTHGQVKEIIKHLDNAKNSHNFSIGGVCWQIRKGVILCYPESHS